MFSALLLVAGTLAAPATPGPAGARPAIHAPAPTPVPEPRHMGHGDRPAPPSPTPPDSPVARPAPLPAGPRPRPGLPTAAPAVVGMSAARLAAVDHVVERGITAGGFPGAAVVIGRRGTSVLQRGYGRLSWSPESPAVTPTRSIYDIASLTKVVGTTTAIMILFDQGRIQLDAPVSRYIPEFSGGEKDLVTVRELLTHRSGLPAGIDLWRMTHDPAAARRIILSTPLAYHPDERYVYSDIGADVLGYIVEAVSGQPLDEFLADYVFHPLGMDDTFFRPDDSVKTRTAPTEIAPPRGYPIQGEVHDENAFAMGGVAGHAGLFSTAADLSVFAQMMLDGGTFNGVRIVADSTVALFTRREIGAGHRALGWDTASGFYGSGEYLSQRAYGHTGFTGTSMWIDPERDLFVILLTNRVHAPRALHPTRVISDVRSDLSDAAVLAVTDLPSGPLSMPETFRADREIGWNAPLRVVRRGPVRELRAKRLSSRHVVVRSRSSHASRTGHIVRHVVKHPAVKHHAVKHPARRPVRPVVKHGARGKHR